MVKNTMKILISAVFLFAVIYIGFSAVWSFFEPNEIQTYPNIKCELNIANPKPVTVKPETGKSEYDYSISIDGDTFVSEKIDGIEKISAIANPRAFMTISHIDNGKSEEYISGVVGKLTQNILAENIKINGNSKGVKYTTGFNFDDTVTTLYAVDDGKGGCFVIKFSHTIEASEGFGTAFEAMARTFCSDGIKEEISKKDFNEEEPKKEQYIPLNEEPAEAETNKYLLKVYKGSQSVIVYSKDTDGNYTVQEKVFTCSTGAKATPTRSGSYITIKKYRWRLLMGPSYGQYSTSFSNDYLFHSVPCSSEKPDTMSKGGYLKLGKPASHGCVRLCVADAKWIYDNCELGTAVEVVDEEGPRGAEPVPLNSDYPGWDPTDPDPGSPYNKN